MDYSIFKAIHVLSVLAWSAGLFYIGRIFVYIASSNHSETTHTLYTMGHRLNRYIILPASIVSTLIGLHLLGIIHALSQPWFHLKLSLLVAIFGYQHVGTKQLKKIKANTFTLTPRQCRIFNEIPIVLLTGIVFCAITKDITTSLIALGTVGLIITLFFIFNKQK